jgi:hypothetical protein
MSRARYIDVTTICMDGITYVPYPDISRYMWMLSTLRLWSDCLSENPKAIVVCFDGLRWELDLTIRNLKTSPYATKHCFKIFPTRERMTRVHVWRSSIISIKINLYTLSYVPQLLESIRLDIDHELGGHRSVYDLFTSCPIHCMPPYQKVERFRDKRRDRCSPTVPLSGHSDTSCRWPLSSRYSGTGIGRCVYHDECLRHFIHRFNDETLYYTSRIGEQRKRLEVVA